MRLSTQNFRWVIINYPVVTSSGKDNTGGHEHLIGNIQAYRLLGFSTLCLCRFSWPLIEKLDGAICLNIVPGLATPESNCKESQLTKETSKRNTLLIHLAGLVRSIRSGFLNNVFRVLLASLSPAIIHQRANKRFMPSMKFGKNSIHLVELNDEFLPDIRCHAYLTVTNRAASGLPQLINPWPVPSCGKFDFSKFLLKLKIIAEGQETIRILLFGISGIESEAAVYEFLENHIWFRSKSIELHIYGAAQDATLCSGRIVTNRWRAENLLPLDFFHAGVVYYSRRMYDDKRLELGSPTKLYKYIDWSLPILTNRPFISQEYLGNYDRSKSVLESVNAQNNYATSLTKFRNNASVEVYASRLKYFIDRLGDTV